MALALAETKNKGKGEATKEAIDSVRRMLAALFKDGLPVINHEEGESNGSGAIAEHTTQPTAPPPATSGSEPVFELEPEIFDEWDVDTSQVITCEGESNGSGAIAEPTTQPTALPPATSESEPVFELEPEIFDEWDVDMSQVVTCESESNGSGAIVTVDHWHTAQSTAQPPTILEPVFEPETVDEWDFDTLINYGGNPDVSGVIADHTAPPPTTSEPVFEPDSVEWSFDDVIFF
jgi:hypothetical protein